MFKIDDEFLTKASVEGSPEKAKIVLGLGIAALGIIIILALVLVPIFFPGRSFTTRQDA